jgi:hypothetical protein
VARIFFDTDREPRGVCPYEISQLPKDTACALVAAFPRELGYFDGVVKVKMTDWTLRGVDDETTLNLELVPFNWKAPVPEHCKKHMNGKIEILDDRVAEKVRKTIESLRDLLEKFLSIHIDFMEATVSVDAAFNVWLLSMDEFGYYPAKFPEAVKTSRCSGKLCNVARIEKDFDLGENSRSTIFDEDVEAAIQAKSVFVADALKRYGFQKIPRPENVNSLEISSPGDLCENCVRARIAIFTAEKNYEIGNFGRKCPRLRLELQTDDNFHAKCKAALKAYDQVVTRV